MTKTARTRCNILFQFHKHMTLMVKAISLLEWDLSKKTKEITCILAISTFASGHTCNHIPTYHINETTYAHAHTHTFVHIYNTNHILVHKPIDKIGCMLMTTRWCRWPTEHMVQIQARSSQERIFKTTTSGHIWFGGSWKSIKSYF